MKRIVRSSLLIIPLFFTACITFDKEHILGISQELLSIFKEAEENGISEINASNTSILATSLRMKGFDEMQISYYRNNNFIESDSIVTFVRKSRNILSSEKRLIYDFSNKPRNFGNEELPNAAYTREQISNRWYYETIGFD